MSAVVRPAVTRLAVGSRPGLRAKTPRARSCGRWSLRSSVPPSRGLRSGADWAFAKTPEARRLSRAPGVAVGFFGSGPNVVEPEAVKGEGGRPRRIGRLGIPGTAGYGAAMYLAMSVAWIGVVVAAVVLVILVVIAGRRASRDRKRQAYDRMLPP